MSHDKLTIDVFGSHTWVETNDNVTINRVTNPLNMREHARNYKVVVLCISLAMLHNITDNRFVCIGTYNSKEQYDLMKLAHNANTIIDLDYLFNNAEKYSRPYEIDKIIN